MSTKSYNPWGRGKSFDLQLFSSSPQTYNGIGSTGARASAVMGRDGYFTGTVRIEDTMSASGRAPGIRRTTINGLTFAATYQFASNMIFYFSEEISNTVEITCNGGGSCKNRLYKRDTPYENNTDQGWYNYGGTDYSEHLSGDRWLSYILGGDKTITITIQFIF